MTAPPPGPFRPGFWRSPLRGPRLTAILGLTLLALVSIVTVTGFLSHVAYQPGLGNNALVEPALPLTFDWPTGPSWLYALNQGLHVNIGLVAVPWLLAKLWSVIPRLFVWPPVASPAQAVERASIALLVASTIFLFATGIANIQYWYVFDFNFVQAHYYAAVVFVAALAVHLVVKLPTALRSLRGPEPRDSPLVAPDPDPPAMSRRALLAALGGGSAALLVANAGESVGGPLRRIAFLAPRREGGFPVNKTAAGAGVTAAMTGPAYRLVLADGNGGEVELSLPDLRALPTATHTLTLGCVEGWSTRQAWTGVPLRELARLAGVPDPAQLVVGSLQPKGILRQATLAANQVTDSRSLLALRVGGADLTPDHGYPARIIVPGLPGVHNTKWVGRMEFRA